MSGARDRSSSLDPDDSWPSQDLRDRTAAEDGGRWPGDDPSAQRPRDAESDWSPWPSTPPAPDDLLRHDAELPVSDPWAESWRSDAAEPAGGSVESGADGQSASFDVSGRPARAYERTPPDASPDPWVPPAPEPEPWVEPEQSPEPWVEPKAPQPEREPPPELDPAGGPIRVSLGQRAEVDGRVRPEAERVSTAEQAVPWLIGVILLLAGMVIVLVALIFAGDESLGAALPSGSERLAIASVEPAATSVEPPRPRPTPTPMSTSTPTSSPTPTPSMTSSEAAVASGEATPTSVAGPRYGPLEMVYQGRSSAGAPIYLLHRDFTRDEESQTVLARDAALDVRRFAWSPDGTVGAGLLSDVLVAIELGKEKRQLADGIQTITFGGDAATVYAVRITRDGGNDVARVLAIDFSSEEETVLARVSYPRPRKADQEPLAAAQFSDEGGSVRLYWVDGGTLRLWVLRGGTWEIDPAGGRATALEADVRPALWSPSGDRRITTALEGGTTTITLLDDAGESIVSTTVTGRVSHVRWAPDGRRVVFTLGRSANGGGIVRDLFLWDLDDKPPMQLTATGTAFGAEWRGVRPLWRD